jgi:hypothetical protein
MPGGRHPRRRGRLFPADEPHVSDRLRGKIRAGGQRPASIGLKSLCSRPCVSMTVRRGEIMADGLSHGRDRMSGGRRREPLAGHAQRLRPIHEISFSIVGR